VAGITYLLAGLAGAARGLWLPALGDHLNVSDPLQCRSRIVFSDVFAGSGIASTVVAVDPRWYRADDWWASDDGRRETRTEDLELGLYARGYC
jgi:hypothetical protein